MEVGYYGKLVHGCTFRLESDHAFCLAQRRSQQAGTKRESQAIGQFRIEREDQVSGAEWLLLAESVAQALNCERLGSVNSVEKLDFFGAL